MAAPMRRRVPWINSEEFEATFNKIYSNDLTQMKHALTMLRVWKVRQPDHLAIGIELTSELLSVKVRDLEENEEEYNEIVRLAYGMTIARFVNHWLEPLQQKECAQPVHLLAKREGIPLWVVDLRHEATHRNLPSLHMLRIAADFVLNYLMNKYWLNNVIPESNLEKCACTGLRAFKRSIMQIFCESLGRQQEEVPAELLTESNLKSLLTAIERSVAVQCPLHGSRSLRENTRELIVQWMKTSLSTANQMMECDGDQTSKAEEELSKLLGISDSNRDISLNNSRWQPVERDEEEDWSRCPLGIYPGQKIRSVELPDKQEASQQRMNTAERSQSRSQDEKCFSSSLSISTGIFDSDAEDSNYELTSISKAPRTGLGNLVAKTLLSFY